MCCVRSVDCHQPSLLPTVSEASLLSLMLLLELLCLASPVFPGHVVWCAEFLAAAKKAVSEGAVIDMANAILQTAGDEEFLQEIVSDLVKEAIDHFKTMREAVPARNVQVRSPPFWSTLRGGVAAVCVAGNGGGGLMQGRAQGLGVSLCPESKFVADGSFLRILIDLLCFLSCIT